MAAASEVVARGAQPASAVRPATAPASGSTERTSQPASAAAVQTPESEPIARGSQPILTVRVQTPATAASESVAHACEPASATLIETPATAADDELADEACDVSGLAPLVHAARQRSASDLHVSSDRAVLIRVIGELSPLDAERLPAARVEAMLMPLLGPRRRARFAQQGYVDLSFEVLGAGRLRGNVSREHHGFRGAFRLAPAVPPSLEQLGLPRELANVVSHNHGLVVIAGPTGHGKTTTMAALVDLINGKRAYHIITIEDPVEIVHPRKAAVITQREVGSHTRSFATALRASLREDPDVIVVGELRDRETVEIALTAAETGHLVLATMNAPSAAKAISRMIDMFAADDQAQARASIAGALRAVVAQRLLPGSRGECMVAAVELVTNALPVAALIRDDKLYQLPNLMQRGRALGMIRIADSLNELARVGRISEDTARRASGARGDRA
jgi:twitching motility protein PilT